MIRSALPTEVAALSDKLRATETAHHAAEARLPKHDWQDWYAAFMVARDHGYVDADAVADRIIKSAIALGG